MTKNVYEGMFLLDSTKLRSDWEQAAKLVHSILEQHGCEIVSSRPWDERKLAYPIKKQRRGMYYLVYFQADSSKVAQIDLDCRLNDRILRHLILKLPPKLVSQLIAQAQTYTAEPEVAEEGFEAGEEAEEGLSEPEEAGVE